MKLKKLEKKRNAYFIYTAIVCFLMVALCLVFVLYLGRKTVSVVSRSSSIDLSAANPEEQDYELPETIKKLFDGLKDIPETGKELVKTAYYSTTALPTDCGIFCISTESDDMFVSFYSNDGEKINLLKGPKDSFFVNLQLVQPYLYVVNVIDRKPFFGRNKQCAILYRLDLSDMSLSHYPQYTLVYYALSNGDILRIDGSGSGSWGGMYTPDLAKWNLNDNLYLSDWKGKNQLKISFDQINEIAGISDPQTTDDVEP